MRSRKRKSRKKKNRRSVSIPEPSDWLVRMNIRKPLKHWSLKFMNHLKVCYYFRSVELLVQLLEHERSQFSACLCKARLWSSFFGAGEVSMACC